MYIFRQFFRWMIIKCEPQIIIFKGKNFHDCTLFMEIAKINLHEKFMHTLLILLVKCCNT